jgi:hypothetical protein
MNSSVTLSVSSQVSETLSLSAAFPWRSLETDAQGRPGTDSSESGPGDVTVSALWSPWASEDDPERFFDYRRLGFVAGLRLPSGSDDLDRFEGVAGKVVPLGNGTFDAFVGASYRTRVGEVRLFDSLILTVPLNESDEDLPPGVQIGTRSAFAVFNRAGAAAPIAGPLSGWLALDVQWKDRSRDPGLEQDDGGTFVWVAPGLVLPLDRSTFEFSAQIPLTDGSPFVTLSVAYPF